MSGPAGLPDPGGPAAAFWTAGADGRLVVLRCPGCERLLHPGALACPDGHGTDLVTAEVSGRAWLVTSTVNAHDWRHPFRTPPYVVAIVALAEDPRVRLTTLLVDGAEDDRTPGAALTARFERHGDVWLPVFGPATDAAAEPVPDFDDAPPARRTDRARPQRRFEEHVAFSGVGASARGRRLGRSGLSLGVEACLAAVEDAGLALDDVDGLAAYPGSAGMPGVSSGGVRDLERALGVSPAWHCGAHEVSGQTGILVEAMLAVAGGLCDHVLCVDVVATDVLPARPDDGRGLRDERQWRVPYGAVSPANWIGLYAERYLRLHGAPDDALGWFAVSARRHAERNPEALHRDPLTMDGYRGSRPISSPFRLLDCDVPCDGAIAFVVSSVAAARASGRPVVRVEAVGSRLTEPQSWDQGTLTHQPNVFGPAEHLWERTDLRPGDVDALMLYDGFTFNALSWIEALGFCDVGEGWALVAGGERIGPGGALPLNPHGGHLCAGRSDGWGHVREAVVQLRGAAGDRQVQGAEVVVTSSGGGIPGGCMLLTVDR